ncbi:unnamed protein product [Calypogeia fissa]
MESEVLHPLLGLNQCCLWPALRSSYQFQSNGDLHIITEVCGQHSHSHGPHVLDRGTYYNNYDDLRLSWISELGSQDDTEVVLGLSDQDQERNNESCHGGCALLYIYK